VGRRRDRRKRPRRPSANDRTRCLPPVAVRGLLLGPARNDRGDEGGIIKTTAPAKDSTRTAAVGPPHPDGATALSSRCAPGLWTVLAFAEPSPEREQAPHPLAEVFDGLTPLVVRLPTAPRPLHLSSWARHHSPPTFPGKPRRKNAAPALGRLAFTTPERSSEKGGKLGGSEVRAACFPASCWARTRVGICTCGHSLFLLRFVLLFFRVMTHCGRRHSGASVEEEGTRENAKGHHFQLTSSTESDILSLVPWERLAR
jgi:hypothetical protein